MTAHLSLSKKSYFAIWHEGSGGRGANNMASAIVKILRQIMVDHPDTKELILRSDSCMCQNRNSVMTLALSLFIQDYRNLEAITQKFCEAGHSNIQEVDSMHSVIQRHLKHQEIFSPLGLVRKLNTIKNTQTIQMTDFWDFQAKAKKEFQFTRVPFTQVRQIKVTRVTGVVFYKLDHESADWTIVSVKTEPRSVRKGVQRKIKEIPLSKIAKPVIGLEKKERHQVYAPIHA
ncbi:DNA repair protein rhp54 [Plakobranchus ocellatus]|uniref:DNA repair protein rhp54 n=1 Tax=Plakobranchus ocellatus TaxID=259542 RepID=A0AAV4CXJ0_9GAST|nr:DNA repair protein rhp54 [Plakobranchus ocellatus]